MNPAAESGGRVLLAAGTETYRYGDLADLDGVPGALQCVVETLTGLGYWPAAPEGAGGPSYLLNPGLQELKDAVRAAAASAPVVVIYYTGHGMKPEKDPYLLVTAEATLGQLEEKALEARKFVRLVLRRDEHDYVLPDDEQPQVLVILDCCFSGAGGAEALKESLQDIGSPKVWVLASAGRVEDAQQGRFAEALQQVLLDPDAGAREPLFDINWVADKINKILRHAGQEAGWYPPEGRSAGFTPFFPNPKYVPDDAGQIWESRLRGAPTDSATAGFYVTGRTGRLRVVEDLAGWMRDMGSGSLAVVTGGPGCGKSAMLALPVLLTDRERRDELIAEAEQGSLLAQAADLFDGLPVRGIHAGGLNLYEVAKAIAKHLGRSADSPGDLLADLEDRPEASPRILVIDAVDEARDPPKLLTDLLQPLTDRPGLRIVLGARRHILAGVTADLNIDLDTEQYRDPQALAGYAHQLLIAACEPDVATPYRGRHDSTAATVAAGIAAKAKKATTAIGQADGQEESFLLAQLLARAVRGRTQVLTTDDDWAKQLPADIGAAFDEDLRHLLGKREPIATVEPIAKALLAALAWAKGPGLPRRWIWGPVAEALAARAGTGALDLDRYGVRWLLDNVGAYIVEDLGPGLQSVFRPFHELIAAHLRGQPSDDQAAADPTALEEWEQRRRQTEKDITRALLGTVPATSDGKPDWEQAHPYLRSYLAEHAAAAGTGALSALVQDADFLAAADPVTLSPLLSFATPELRDIARIYRRALPQLGSDPRANAAYVQAAARTGIRHLDRPQVASVHQDADQQHWLPRPRHGARARAAHLQEAARVSTGTAAERTGIRHLDRPQVEPVRRADQELWLSRLRSGPQESTTGFYLTGETGRLRAVADLAAWMRDPGRGLAVVTGSPGCGKSAMLALPVLLTSREQRELLVARAGPRSLVARAADLFDGLPVIGVNARGMDFYQVAGRIAQDLGRSTDSPYGLLEDLDERPETSSPILVIDAVDEARDPSRLLNGVVLPLARRPDLQVVIGARRHVLAGMADADLTIDLDTEEYQDPQALTEYIHNLLIASAEPGVITPYQSGNAATAVAVTLAQRARGSFLVGEMLALAARGHAETADITREGWRTDLPASVPAAFDEDLARFGSKAPLARALLTALAWARGPGLPWEDIWVLVARALVRLDSGVEEPTITEDGVRWLLDNAGAYIVEEVGLSQRAVFRVFHEMLAEHLRGDSNTEQGSDSAVSEAWSQRHARAEQAITGALLGTVPAGTQGRDWVSAHPYLRSYLAEHAAAAGPEELSGLVHDADFLATADPLTLSPLLSFAIPELRDIARTYGRARPQLGTDVRANAAYLQEAARALAGTAGERTGIRPLYRTQLTSVRQDNSVLAFTGRAGAVFSVALGASPDGRALLASGGEDGTVRLWDLATGSAAGGPLTGHEGWVFSVAFGASPDSGTLLASGGEDGTVRLWDPTTGAAAGAPLTGHAGGVFSVAFGADPDSGTLLASGGEDGTVRLWDPITGAAAGEPLTGHTGPVQAVAFGASPDGRLLLASGGWDGTVRLWDLAASAAAGAPLTGHAGGVFSVAFGASPDGRALLASGGGDGTVRLWDPITCAAAGAPLTGHTGPVEAVAFGASPDGRALLASGGGDGTVRLWDPITGAAAGAPPTGHTGPVQTVAFGASPDGQLLLASGSWDNTVRLWDLVAGAAVGEPLTGHTGPVQTIAFGGSSDGRRLLASGSWDNTVRLWDPFTGATVGALLTGHTGSVQAVAFGAAPDGGALLASGGGDGTVRLWDPFTGAAVGAPLTGHAGGVFSVAFGAAPDGRALLASGGEDGTVRLWDPTTGAAVGEPLTGHTGPVQTVAFGASPDGQLLLASGSWDNTVRLWDPFAGATVGEPLTGHTGPVQTVAFGVGPDGRRLLASGSWDNSVRFWELAAATCIVMLQRRCSVNSIEAVGLMLAIGDDEGISVIELER